MSSKLVYISDYNQFASLEPEEGCYNYTKDCTLPYLYDNIEMSGQVGAHPVVASPGSMADNHLLYGLGSQQPWQKEYQGFTKNNAQYVQA